MIRCVACGAALWLAAAPFATAQLPGSVALDRARLREITGNDSAATNGEPLLVDWVRPLRRIPRVPEMRLQLVRPETRVSYNSDIPFSLNDGPLWAGRGWSVSVSGGLRGERDIRNVRVRLTIAPTLVYAQNLPFQFFPDSTPGRSIFASPFHGPRASADLPSRFGDRHLLYVDAGRTALTVRTRGGVLAGITSESEVWGPGIRNALVLSANAPGIPRLFIQTPAPVHTRVGAVEAKLIAGTLTESLFFDLVPTNDFRSISGILVQLRPAFDSTLMLGLSRVVYAPIVSPVLGPIGHAADVLVRWAHVADPDDPARYRSVDQIMSAFARWVFPDAGFEVYGEFARMDLPRSFTELLIAPHHTGGYTVGFQWAQPRRGHDYLRLQSEITYLEQSLVFNDRPPPDFYTGRVSPQGYTQRGQVIGAAIGPGASSQWIAVDYLAPRWQGGVYVGRIRWDNDALYRQLVPNFFRHDVSVLAGARGGWRSALSDVSVDVTFARRYNYLFQNGQANPGGFRTVDIKNLTITLAATPH